MSHAATGVPRAFQAPFQLQSRDRFAGRGIRTFKELKPRTHTACRSDQWSSKFLQSVAFTSVLCRRVTRPKVARPQGQGAARDVASNSGGMWFMLLAVSLCSATNAFLCMTFSVIEHLSAEALAISTLEVAGLYTIWLVTALAGLAPGTWMTDRSQGFTLTWSALFNAASAVVRIFGAQQGSYKLIVASQILCGAGAWPIFTLPSKISHRCFPVRLRALATSIMLQANYAGWLLGIMFPALILKVAPSFTKICTIQSLIAVCASVVALLTLKAGMARRPPPKESVVASSSGFSELVQAMVKYPRFTVQMLAHGTLGGVSFAAPSAIFFILDNYGFSLSAALAVNLAFVASGVVSGIYLGRVCTQKKHYGKALAVCYSTCLASLTVCALLAANGMLGGSGWKFWALLLLCIVSGGSSLGFIGIGIEATSRYPVRPSFVGWGVETGVLGCAAVLSYYAAGRSGFTVLAITTALCTMAHFASYNGGQTDDSKS